MMPSRRAWIECMWAFPSTALPYRQGNIATTVLRCGKLRRARRSAQAVLLSAPAILAARKMFPPALPCGQPHPTAGTPAMDARSTSNTQTHSAAYFLLEGLNEIGIDYLFCNFGTDHAPIIEELANRKQRGEPVPKTIRCAHENTAAHMAAGYALMTGRGQGVLVHVDVGTANTANAMHNLFRSRLPVLLMAGKAPYTTAHELVGTRDTYVHFVQEPFDQGSLVRPYVKWEWTLPSGIVAKEV